MWYGIVSTTKYLNSTTLINKCMDILSKFTGTNIPNICHGLSKNPSLRTDIILAHPNVPWNLDTLFDNIYIDDIEDRGLDYSVSENPNELMTLEMCLITPDMSSNHCLTMDMVLAFPDEDWD